jgi:hypothetical protein
MSGSGRSELCDPMAQVTQTKLQKQLFPLHCKEIPIYVFSEKEIARPQPQYPYLCVCE